MSKQPENLKNLLLTYKKDKDFAAFLANMEAQTALMSVLQAFLADRQKPLTIDGVEKIKGDKGDTPIRGVDYFTEADVKDFLNQVTPVKGVHYFTQEDIDILTKVIVELVTPVKGKDYFTREEIEDFKILITPKKGVDYFDGEPGKPGKDAKQVSSKEIIDDLKKDKTFVDSIKGKDGSSDTGVEIIAKINAAPADKKIPASRIEGLDTYAGHRTLHRGGSAINILDEGVSILDNAQSINFVGSGVAVTLVSGVPTVTINGGGGSGDISVNGATVSNPNFIDSAEIALSVATSNISLALVAGSIDETKLDASVNASLDLADTSVQPNDDITTAKVTAVSSAGILLEASNGTDVGILGAGNTANVTWYGSHNYDTATASTIASFGASKTLSSLSTATYPDLTELSYVKGVTSAIQTQLDGKVASNASITGATKTKITYDAKGLVTAGDDATTADISDSSDRRYVTDAQLTVIAGTSGTNTGDVTLSGTPDYITISGQVITRHQVDLTSDVTGDLPLSNVAGSGSASKLLGRGDSGAGDWQEITLGANLTMSGTTLSATGGGGSGDVTGPASSTDNAITRFDGTTGKIIQNSAATIADTTGDIVAGTYNGNTIGSGSTSGTNTGDQNLFGTIAVSGQDSVVADSTNDTLTLVAGTNITITTNATTDTVTISATDTDTGITQLTGDVTAGPGSGSQVATIANDVVTFAKMQNISTDRLLGRDTASTGDVEEITVGGGIEFTTTGGVQTSAFTGDATKPAGGTTLTLATVNSNTGTFGSATQVGTFTVNGKGLITAASNTSISITSSAVSDFAEAAQDSVGNILNDGSTINFTYDDITPGITAEVIDNSIGDSKIEAGVDAAKISSGVVTNTEFDYLSGVSSNIQDQLTSLGEGFDARVPYSGASSDVDLGENDLYVRTIRDSGTANLGFVSAGFDYSSDGTYYGTVNYSGLTVDRTYTMPDATGTIALTSDIPTIKESIGFTIDGGGSAISTGKVKGYFTCPYAGTITGWNIMVDAGTATVEVWKVATGTAVPTSGNSINTSGVSISSGTAVHSSTVTDFTTTAVAANDIFAFEVTAVSTATEMSFGLEITRT